MGFFWWWTDGSVWKIKEDTGCGAVFHNDQFALTTLQGYYSKFVGTSILLVYQIQWEGDCLYLILFFIVSKKKLGCMRIFYCVYFNYLILYF